MSRFKISLLPEAEAEFREAFIWYFERSLLAADAFRAEVMAAVDDLADDADTWPANEDGVRHRILTRFSYTIHYDLNADEATVLAIAHHKRRPGYWSGRA